jgi:hypothetical protein
MIVDVHLKERSHSRSFILLFVFVLAGCLPEETIIRTPKPSLPSLQCSPFIKTGYCEKISYHPGEKIRVFLQSTQPQEICRLTIYGISGDSVLSVASSLPAVPGLPTDASENGYKYPVAAEFILPEMPSGVYLIEKKIPLIVKSSGPVDLMIVYPSNTANAYSRSGGKSLYGIDRAPAVSFQRPIELEAFSEYCLKWFTTLPDFRIGYVADKDMDDYENVMQAKVLVIPGHSEYWTREARSNFDRFVDAGGHALVLSGNTMWWQVRYSDDESKMICYKDNVMDPVGDPAMKTVEWIVPALQYPILSSIGADFSRGGYGLRDDTGWNGYRIAEPTSPLLEGLGLARGDIIAMPSVEYDGAPIAEYDEDGYPLLDKQALGFDKVELVAFDKGYRVTETTATFIVFRKTAASGIVINTASTDWCSLNGIGGSSKQKIKTITYNALNKLVNDERVFSQ